MTSLEFCSSADAALGVRMSRHCNLQKKRCPAPAAGGVARLKALQTKHALIVHCRGPALPPWTNGLLGALQNLRIA